MAEEGGDLLTSGIKPEGEGNQSTSGSEGDKPSVTSSTENARELHPYESQFGKDLQGHKSFEKLPTISDVGKAYIEIEGKLGNSIVIPGEDATPEEHASFHTRMGKPDSPQGYEFGDAKAPEGTSFDAMREQFRGIAHEAHLNKEQAAKVDAWYTNQYAASVNALRNQANTNREKSLEILKAEYGADYDANVALAGRAIEALADKSFVEFTRSTGLANHPEMIKTFVKIGKAMGEGSFPTGDPSPVVDERTQELEARYPKMAAHLKKT